MLSPQEALRDLDVKVQRIVDSIDVIKEKQEDMSEHVSQIHGALYDPDKGLYARIRDLEVLKSTSTKLMWMVVSSLVALTAAAYWQHLN